MTRRPLGDLYENPDGEQIFCADCQLLETCRKTGLPKVTAANRAAFTEYQLIKAIPAYVPRPFYAGLRDRILIIEGEIAKIEREKAKQDAGRENF